ncbi:hypothetical protein [Stenotrophomonas phage CM2]
MTRLRLGHSFECAIMPAPNQGVVRMSVIVYDGHMLACDMQISTGNIRTFGSKLHKLTLRDGDEDKDFFVAVIGCITYSAVVLAWFRDNLLLDPHLRAPHPITRAMEEDLGHTAVVASTRTPTA